MSFAQLISRRYSVRACRSQAVEPVVFTPLGYPGDSRRSKKRKAADELVCRDRWEG